MENAQVEDITEKVANVLIAGATPIYYGTHEMFRVSNRHRFILYDIEQPGLFSPWLTERPDLIKTLFFLK